MDSSKQEQRSVVKEREKSRRRRYAVEEKLAIIRECLEPGASLAGVALAHRANANMVRKWVVKFKARGFGSLSKSSTALLPVVMKKPATARPAVTAAAVKAALEIELLHGVLRIYGPVDAKLLTAVALALSGR
jgi:transposase